jgi:hypothetical protein
VHLVQVDVLALHALNGLFARPAGRAHGAGVVVGRFMRRHTHGVPGCTAQRRLRVVSRHGAIPRIHTPERDCSSVTVRRRGGMSPRTRGLKPWTLFRTGDVASSWGNVLFESRPGRWKEHGVEDWGLRL